MRVHGNRWEHMRVDGSVLHVPTWLYMSKKKVVPNATTNRKKRSSTWKARQRCYFTSRFHRQAFHMWPFQTLLEGYCTVLPWKVVLMGDFQCRSWHGIYILDQVYSSHPANFLRGVGVHIWCHLALEVAVSVPPFSLCLTVQTLQPQHFLLKIKSTAVTFIYTLKLERPPSSN